MHPHYSQYQKIKSHRTSPKARHSPYRYHYSMQIQTLFMDPLAHTQSATIDKGGGDPAERGLYWEPIRVE